MLVDATYKLQEGLALYTYECLCSVPPGLWGMQSPSEPTLTLTQVLC